MNMLKNPQQRNKGQAQSLSNSMNSSTLLYKAHETLDSLDSVDRQAYRGMVQDLRRQPDATSQNQNGIPPKRIQAGEQSYSGLSVNNTFQRLSGNNPYQV